MAKKESDLTFLLETCGFRFTPSMFKEIVERAKAGENAESMAKHMEIKLCSVKSMLGELRAAAREGYTLEDYISKNRPLRIKNNRKKVR